MKPSKEAYPGFNREAKAFAEKQELVGEAKATALPGALREAFAGEPQRVCGCTLLPVTAGLEAILTRIESPLLPMFGLLLANRGKSQQEIRKVLERKIRPGPEAFVETVFCFVRPPAELRSLLDKGRQAFREAAMKEIGDRMHPLQVAELQQAVSEHYMRAFLTAVGYKSPPGDSQTFTAPPAESRTASAGG